MAQGSDYPAGGFEAEDPGRVLSGFLADEMESDRRSLLRLGAWGAASVGAVVLAMLASQSSIKFQRAEVASSDLALQSQQIRSVAKLSQNETQRLAAAIESLNSDRERLYARIVVLEQGLDTVTGAIARQNSAAAVTLEQSPTLAPVAAPVATISAAATDGPPIAAAPDPVTVAKIDAAAPTTPRESTPPVVLLDSVPAKAAAVVPPADTAEFDASPAPSAEFAVQRTEFGVDIGSANSLSGLRSLWRSLVKSNQALAALRPIIAVKEIKNGLGLQVRLIAGPLGDGAAAAKLCATLAESKRACETAVFDGQRLAMMAPEPPAKRATQKPGVAKRSSNDDASRKPESPRFSSLFGRR